MKVFTSHLRPGQPPILVREGWSWLGAIFGWLYLLFHRAWIPAALNLLLALLAMRAGRWLHSGMPALALFIVQGLFARDLWRWSLAQRGLAPGPVVAASDEDAALARLLPTLA